MTPDVNDDVRSAVAMVTAKLTTNQALSRVNRANFLNKAMECRPCAYYLHRSLNSSKEDRSYLAYCGERFVHRWKISSLYGFMHKLNLATRMEK